MVAPGVGRRRATTCRLAGTYTITLTVIDPACETSSVSHTITVADDAG